MLFALLPVYWALLAQYIIALVGSTISYFALRQMPDAPRPTALGLATVARDTPRQLFAPSVFRRYVPLAIAFVHRIGKRQFGAILGQQRDVEIARVQQATHDAVHGGVEVVDAFGGTGQFRDAEQ